MNITIFVILSIIIVKPLIIYDENGLVRYEDGDTYLLIPVIIIMSILIDIYIYINHINII